MVWVKASEKRRCGNCGILVERWVLQRNSRRKVAEATFCPTCYPDLKKAFDAAEPGGDLDGEERQPSPFPEPDEIPSYPFLFPEDWFAHIRT